MYRNSASKLYVLVLAWQKVIKIPIIQFVGSKTLQLIFFRQCLSISCLGRFGGAKLEGLQQNCVFFNGLKSSGQPRCFQLLSTFSWTILSYIHVCFLQLLSQEIWCAKMPTKIKIFMWYLKRGVVFSHLFSMELEW